MKPRLLALTTLGITIVSAIPATSQIRTPSQDFFNQGRERLEREIQILTPTGSDNADRTLKIEPGVGERIQAAEQNFQTGIDSEDEASNAVLNTDVVRRRIQSLEKLGARVGVTVVASPSENEADYYLVQLQEIKPENNVTVDSFCVYRSGVVAQYDYITDRCVSLDGDR